MRRLPLATTALGVALLAAVAGGSRILARRGERQATSERDEHGATVSGLDAAGR